MTDPRIKLATITADKPFTKRQRQRLARQTGLGHRPLNNWHDGDLPAPWAEGDLLLLPEGVENDRLYGMGPGYFVVSCAFSIDEGDAWYFRVANHADRGSDRLHVACAERSTWDEDCDWMAGFQLIDTADPDGLEERAAMLARGWTFTPRLTLASQVAEARSEIAQLRKGLRQVAEGDYPIEAGSPQDWAREIRDRIESVDWEVDNAN